MKPHEVVVGGSAPEWNLGIEPGVIAMRKCLEGCGPRALQECDVVSQRFAANNSPAQITQFETRMPLVKFDPCERAVLEGHHPEEIFNGRNMRQERTDRV